MSSSPLGPAPFSLFHAGEFVHVLMQDQRLEQILTIVDVLADRLSDTGASVQVPCGKGQVVFRFSKFFSRGIGHLMSFATLEHLFQEQCVSGFLGMSCFRL